MTQKFTKMLRRQQPVAVNQVGGDSAAAAHGETNCTFMQSFHNDLDMAVLKSSHALEHTIT
jgi:hypothetical protein